MAYYFASDNIEVYPSGFRGSGYAKAKLTTEENITRQVGVDNCLVEISTDTYLVKIKGYSFIFSKAQLLATKEDSTPIPTTNADIYLSIKTRLVDPVIGDVLDRINRPSTGEGSTIYTLDQSDLFYGCAITLDASLPSNNGSIKIGSFSSGTFSPNKDIVFNSKVVAPIFEGNATNADTVDSKHASDFATSAQGTLADNAVPNTRKINNKALSNDLTLTPTDIGAEPSFSKNTAFNKNFDTSSQSTNSTKVIGDKDTRLSDSRPANGGTATNVSGTGKLGTTTGSTSITNRQPDHIFETNSNTVKNATNANKVKIDTTYYSIRTTTTTSDTGLAGYITFIL